MLPSGNYCEVKEMQRPAILQWDKVICKGTRTKDGEPIGYIAAEAENSIIVLSSHFREYLIRKSHVNAFEGSQVHLDFPSQRTGNTFFENKGATLPSLRRL